MNESKNITIALLLAAAMILGGLVLVTWNDPAQAAATHASRSGDYIMVTGSWRAGTDILYVVDVRAQRMNAYFVDTNTNVIQLRDTVDLARLFAQN